MATDIFLCYDVISLTSHNRTTNFPPIRFGFPSLFPLNVKSLKTSKMHAANSGCFTSRNAQIPANYIRYCLSFLSVQTLDPIDRHSRNPILTALNTSVTNRRRRRRRRPNDVSGVGGGVGGPAQPSPARIRKKHGSRSN